MKNKVEHRIIRRLEEIDFLIGERIKRIRLERNLRQELVSEWTDIFKHKL